MRTPRAVMVCVSALLGALVWLTSSAGWACGNATMEDDPAYRSMRAAERALGEGDVLGAREGAAAAKKLDPRLTVRATWVTAMSFVRDPEATEPQLAEAVRILAEVRPSRRDPRFDAGYGEALARAGRDDEGFDVLEPLARRELLGDPYGYGALARIARSRGDETRAEWALQRCMTIATHGSQCRLVYPPRPLLRGSPTAFAGLGLVVLAFVAARRRRTGADAPWRGYADGPRALLTLAAGVPLVLSALSPVTGVALVGAALVAGSLLERRMFLRAVRRGKIADLVVRPREPVDASLGEVRLFFGPASPETLERVADGAYRDTAREPLLRLGRRSAAPLVVMFCAAIVLTAGAASLLVLSRASASAEPVPAGP